MSRLLETLKSLETAEDFLDHFGIRYEQRVVDVNRLHILQRLHDRLAVADLERMDEGRLYETMSTFLAGAYRDFVVSDARTEKVFKVFHRAGAEGDRSGRTTIPLAEVLGVARRDEP
ncbi:MAG: nitrogenase-stabilizing/protective protein NifW [Rhodospirillales bacterium]